MNVPLNPECPTDIPEKPSRADIQPGISHNPITISFISFHILNKCTYNPVPIKSAITNQFFMADLLKNKLDILTAVVKHVVTID